MRRIKIWWVITKGDWGGAQKYVYELASALSPDHFDRRVLSGKAGELTGRLEARGIPVLILPALKRDVGLVDDLKSFLSLGKTFRSERPDIVHLNSSKAAILGALAARLAGVPKIIFTAHGWPFYEDRSRFSLALIKIISWLTVICAHQTIVLNDRDLNSFKRWPGVRGKIVKIYNGIGDEAGYSAAEARQILHRDYGLPVGGPLLGSIAELHRNKGLSYLIRALKQLPPAVKLCLIGDGEERKNLERLIEKEDLTDRVFLTGFVAEASKFIRAFDLFVLPSVKEGLPFVLLEAGVNGAPIVATRSGGVPEIIDHGQNGAVVPPRDPSALADEIGKLLADPVKRKIWGQNLQDKIKTAFSVEQMRQKTFLLYSFTPDR